MQSLRWWSHEDCFWNRREEQGIEPYLGKVSDKKKKRRRRRNKKRKLRIMKEKLKKIQDNVQLLLPLSKRQWSEAV